jgi:flagellar biosynthesis protein FlhB
LDNSKYLLLGCFLLATLSECAGAIHCIFCIIVRNIEEVLIKIITLPESQLSELISRLSGQLFACRDMHKYLWSLQRLFDVLRFIHHRFIGFYRFVAAWEIIISDINRLIQNEACRIFQAFMQNIITFNVCLSILPCSFIGITI